MEKIKWEAEKYKNYKLPDIIAWCQANGQVPFLKTIAAKTVKRPIYPTVEVVSKTGKRTKRQDKNQAPIGYKEEKMSFMEIRSAFFNEFFDMPQKEEESKPNMWDIIANL